MNTNIESDSMMNLCEQILNLDKSIRFVGISNNIGDVITAKYGENITPLLSGIEAEMSIFQSITRIDSVQAMKDKLGKIIYVAEVFENVKRATIILDSDCFLLVSFNAYADHDAIIMNKIYPIVKQII